MDCSYKFFTPKIEYGELRAGFVTLWKSLENSLIFHFFWKSLETSGFGMILNFLFWTSLENAFALKLKILILILRKSCFLNFQHVVLLTV